MWYSHIHFTADKQYGGGFNFDHNSNNIVLSDFYMSSELTNRYDETKEKAQYKAIAGSLGKDSRLKTCGSSTSSALPGLVTTPLLPSVKTPTT